MAKRFKPEYSVGDILSLYETRKNDGDEARLRGLVPTIRALCDLKHEVKIPSQYESIGRQVRTPFIRDAAHRIAASLCRKPPVGHITPKDDDRQDYREAANIAERFDAAMIERICKELGTDIVYDLTFGTVRDGESVLNVVHRPDAWANFPERNTDEDPDDYKRRVREYKRGVDLPIAWRVVDRLCCVYEGGEYGDQWVIDYGEFSKAYCKEKYRIGTKEIITPDSSLEGRPMPEGLAPRNNGVRVRLQFFDAYEWHVIVDGKEAPGFPKRNPYAPYLPYFRAHTYGYDSLLYSLLFLVPRLDELLTMKLVWSYLGAYPNPVIETSPNSAGYPLLDGPMGNAGDAAGATGQVNVLKWSPGKAMTLPIGQTIRFLEPPPVGKDLNELVVILKSLIDIAGVPSIMRGMSGSGDSGYLANQLLAAAEMAYKITALSLQRQLEKATEFSHWLVSNVVQQTVYVMGWDSINPKTGRPTDHAKRAWLGLSPDHQTKNVADVSKLGPVTIQFRPTLPTDEQARAMIALQLTNSEKPLYDRRHALETWMQEEDPESILDALYVEQALEEEPLRSMVVENALREAGILPAQQATPNPAQQLVDQYGNPMSPGMAGVPLANQAPPGMPGVPGLTMPLQPQQPQGIPGNAGGRPAGAYPGQPGNQGG